MLASRIGGLNRPLIRAASAALLIGGAVLAPALLAAPEASASPATNCTLAGSSYGGVDPHYYGFTATCTDTPDGEWRLLLYCESYGGKDVTAYGGLVFGSGKSIASCPGSNYEVNGWDIQNLQ